MDTHTPVLLAHTHTRTTHPQTLVYSFNAIDYLRVYGFSRLYFSNDLFKAKEGGEGLDAHMSY